MATNVADNNIYLFNARTTDGNGTAMPVPFPNNDAIVEAFGTWGGASVKLQSLAADNSTWIDVVNKSGSVISFSANGQLDLDYLIPNQSLRGVMSSSSGTTSVSLVLRRI